MHYSETYSLLKNTFRKRREEGRPIPRFDATSGYPATMPGFEDELFSAIAERGYQIDKEHVYCG